MVQEQDAVILSTIGKQNRPLIVTCLEFQPSLYCHDPNNWPLQFSNGKSKSDCRVDWFLNGAQILDKNSSIGVILQSLYLWHQNQTKSKIFRQILISEQPIKNIRAHLTEQRKLFFYYPPSSKIYSCVRTDWAVMCLHTWRSPAV